jgi:SIR2-like domain
MSFASLDQPQIESLTERFSTAGDLTLMVGAGASMEADLPSWPKLIEGLLLTVASERTELSDEDAKREWIDRTLDSSDLLGAGAVVEVMATDPLEELIPAQLYGEAGPSGYLPGPIAHQVAYLRGCFGERMEILTTNYDDLIERALIDSGVARSRVRSYGQYRKPKNRASGVSAVFHLHGIAPREGEPKAIVLTEEQYHSMQRGSSWQERTVTERLETSLSLFVGMSLSDPNLIRYLYGYESSATRKHAAIFVRQGQAPRAEKPKSNEEVQRRRAVQTALEQAETKRWERCGVEAIFVDHFADAAQLLYEIGLRKSVGEEYEPVGVRAAELIGDIERKVFLVGKSQEQFGQRQVRISEFLRDLLFGLLQLALGGDPPADEKFALALWLNSPDGTEMTGWAHSDRAHQDPSTISPVEISEASDWVAIQTVCRGTRVELNRSNYASRWHFVRGLPLVVETPSRLPLGCLTISSDKRGAESVLTSMPEQRRALLHRTLTGTVLEMLMRLSGHEQSNGD